jgi:DNA polymerase delta subunit 2
VRPDSFVSDSDYAVLEDASGRVRLGGALPIRELVTGMIVAVRGAELASGEFEVRDFCLPGLAPQEPLPTPAAAGVVALVSGLRVGTASPGAALLPLLCAFLTGAAGAPADVRFAARIVRVIVAGNTVNAARDAVPSAFRNMVRRRVCMLQPADAAAAVVPICGARFVGAGGGGLHAGAAGAERARGPDARRRRPVRAHATAAAVRARDSALANGARQPATADHRGGGQFPHAAQWATFTGVTNPYECALGGVRILGTSGQPVDDISHYLSLPSASDVRARGGGA